VATTLTPAPGWQIQTWQKSPRTAAPILTQSMPAGPSAPVTAPGARLARSWEKHAIDF